MKVYYESEDDSITHRCHPIILPRSSVTELIIDQEHRRNHHSRTQSTLYAVRQRYWPVDGRSQVCITESRLFTNIGIDYCCPFYIKERRDRNRRKVKVYVAVFICLAIKAVHIELASDLTTDAFLAALHQFISCREHCEIV
jgi:hypothetical protein